MDAYINPNRGTVHDDLDTLQEVPTTTLKGSQLKNGMILVDPILNTPEAETTRLATSAKPPD